MGRDILTNDLHADDCALQVLYRTALNPGWRLWHTVKKRDDAGEEEKESRMRSETHAGTDGTSKSAFSTRTNFFSPYCPWKMGKTCDCVVPVACATISPYFITSRRARLGEKKSVMVVSRILAFSPFPSDSPCFFPQTAQGAIRSARS